MKAVLARLRENASGLLSLCADTHTGVGLRSVLAQNFRADDRVVIVRVDELRRVWRRVQAEGVVIDDLDL